MRLRRHRYCERGRIWYPAHIRLVVLEFPNAEEAKAWDDAGQPIEIRPLVKEPQT